MFVHISLFSQSLLEVNKTMFNSTWLTVSLLFFALPLLHFYRPQTKALNSIKVTIIEWQASLRKIKPLLPYIVAQTKSERRYALLLLLGILACVSIGRGINILNPLILRWILASIGKDKATTSFPWQLVSGYVVLRYFIKDLLSFFQWTIMRRLENQILDRISIAVYDKLMSLSASYQDQKDSSTAWSTVIYSGRTVSRFASNVCFGILPNVLDLLFAVISFSTIGSPQLAIVVVVVLVSYGYTLIKTARRSEKDIKEWEEADQKRRKQASQTIFNWWTVSLFDQIPCEMQNHRDVVENQRAVDTRWCDGHWFKHNAKNVVISSGLLLIYLMLSHEIWQGKRDAADLVMFIHQWSELLRPVQDIIDWNEKIISFGRETEKLIDIMSEEPSVKDKQDAVDYNYQGGSLIFQGVSFSYKDKKESAIEDISFDIPPGSIVAIVGQSGGGKSTILKLIKRCYNAAAGAILVDGQNIEDVRKDSLSKAIGFVPQNIGVFPTTVLENVRYARPEASLEECKSSCEAVGLHHIIDKDVRESGNSLSGGELQRVAIARALIQNPSILLLDEATSHLDSDTEANIFAYLHKWRQGRTVIMIAHTFTSILDREVAYIIAMKHGRIVEQGKEADLLLKKGYYYDLWNKQQLG